MMENGYSIGGEQSGHIIFSKYATTGDGILTSLMVMEVMLESKKKLSELLKDLKIYPQVLKNVRVRSKEEALNDEEVLKVRDEVAKELGDDGRILLRKSGTEPVVRIMVEATSDEICEEHIAKVVDILSRTI